MTALPGAPMAAEGRSDQHPAALRLSRTNSRASSGNGEHRRQGAPPLTRTPLDSALLGLGRGLPRPVLVRIPPRDT